MEAGANHFGLWSQLFYNMTSLSAHQIFQKYCRWDWQRAGLPKKDTEVRIPYFNDVHGDHVSMTNRPLPTIGRERSLRHHIDQCPSQQQIRCGFTSNCKIKSVAFKPSFDQCYLAKSHFDGSRMCACPRFPRLL